MFDLFTVRKVLIIAPLRVARDTWSAEIEKWEHLKPLRYSIAVGTEEERLAALNAPADLYIINRENIAKMKDGVVIINTSRGTNVDEAALLDALNSGKVRAAGLDVYADEPATNVALYSHPMVSCTPHIGSATVEAQGRIGEELVEIISKM